MKTKVMFGQLSACASLGLLLAASTAWAGGYVNGTQVLTQAKSIQTSTVSTVATFNNATLTDQNNIAETNNNPIKTPSTSDPVSTVTGNNYHDETDLVIRGRGFNFAFTRTYNSAPSAKKIDLGLGFGWTHSYSMRLKSNDYGVCPNCTSAQAAENGNGKTSSVTYTDERGGDHNYLVNESTYAVTLPQGEFDTLTLDSPAAGQHTITFRNGTRYVFQTVGAGSLKTTPNVAARLIQIADAYGYQLNFGYDASGRLSTVTDNLAIAGRTGLTFGYVGTSTHISTLTDWSGRQWSYGYDGAGNLTSMTNPLSQQIQYGYVAGTHNLTTVTLPLARGGKAVATTFNYYQNGRTFNYSDSLGNTETLDYDLYRKTTAVTDPRGGIREYEYDASGRLTKLTEPDGAILMFQNGPDGLRYKKTDGLGYATTYSYRSDKSFNTASDTYGNVTREQDALSQTVDTTYGPYDQPATVKDKRGTVSTTTYYSVAGACAVVGKPQRVSLSILSGTANVPLVDYCWNADGTLSTKTEYILPGNTTRKRTTSYTYQPGTNNLNVQQMTVTGATAGGSVTVSYTYDALGRKQTETLTRRTSAVDATPLSLTTTYGYDALDRVITVTDPSGNYQETVYDANGKVYQVIGHYKKLDGTFDVRTLTTRTYDAADRLATETDVLGNATTYSYDAAGNVQSVTDAENHTTTYEYDAMGRRTAVIDANGNRTETAYDLAGHVVSVKNANGETIANVYDAIGRLTQVTDPKGYVTQYQYDANGNRTCVIDANAQAGLQPKNADGCTATTTYDELNRAVQVKDAQGNLTKTAYDLLGNVLSVTDATNKVTAYGYDDLGRKVTVTDPLTKTTTLTWDEAGNLLTKTNRLNQTTRATYDKLNRPTLVEYLTDGTTESFGYNIYGNRTTAANGTVSYTFGYDAKNRLTTKLDSRAGKSLAFTYDKVGNILTKTDFQGHTTTYRYDSTNRVVSSANPDYLEVSYQYDSSGHLLSRILSNGATASYTYDPDGFLASLIQRSADGTVLSSATYIRDRVGNTLTQSDLAGTTTYAYDPLYRLSSATYPGTLGSESWTYDAVGNRQVHTQNGTAHAYEYWPSSNRLKAVHTGTLAGAVEKSLVFDDEGRLTSQTGTGAKTFTWDQKSRATSITANARTLTFQYDPMDYRIGSRNATQGNKDYYLEGEHLEAIYSGNNLQAKYHRGTTIDELVASWQFDPAGNWTPYIYHHDITMSVTGVSGHAGAALQQTIYGAFGNVLSETGTTTNYLKYTGRESDTDTGLYYYRARYYDPTLGRFESEDPLGFKGSGTNWYAYVDNNPITFNDPTGCDKYSDIYSQTFSTIANGAKVAVGNLIPDTVNGMAAWAESFSHRASGSFGRMDSWVDVQNPIAQGVANDLRGVAAVGTAMLPLGSSVSLYRAVGPAELADIQATNAFRNPSGLETKYFTTTGPQASAYAKEAVTAFGDQPYTIVSTKAPASILETPGSFAQVEKGIQAYALPNEAFSGLTPTVLNYSPVSFAQGSGLGSTGSWGVGVAWGAGAAGGYLLYPNQPNTNAMSSLVYAK